MVHHLLLAVLLGTGYWQLAPRQGAHMHMVYRSRHDKVLGGISQETKYSPYQVQCTGGTPGYEPTERDAKRVVEACPE
jgi:hypothetical protein